MAASDFGLRESTRKIRHTRADDHSRSSVAALSPELVSPNPGQACSRIRSGTCAGPGFMVSTQTKLILRAKLTTSIELLKLVRPL